MPTGLVAPTIRQHIQQASVGDNIEEERDREWLSEVLARMQYPNNYQFFRRIAGRKDSERLVRTIIRVLRGTKDLNWVLHEAEKVFGAGVPPFQQKLLSMIREAQKNHST